MSDLSKIFGEGAKVVISPDKMRAWVTLPKPPKGVRYTAEAIAEWLPQNGVIFGASEDLMRKAASSDRYDDLLEVARGQAPVPETGGDYKLTIEKKPFTGLRATGDGSLIYDDLSFLQEVEAGTVLAEILPPTPAMEGMTVTGESLLPREGTPGRVLEGSGFKLSPDGKQALAPSLSHVNVVNDKLMVTPLSRMAAICEEDGELAFEGNVLVEGDVTSGAKFSATGSVFVVGRCVSCSVKAGNNVLLCGGMRSGGGGFGNVEAQENVWGLFFEACDIKAGGDICAGHLTGCEVTVGGRASILGGKASVSGSNLLTRDGVVTGTIGGGQGGETVVQAGMGKELVDRYAAVNKKADKLNIDILALQQNITAHERVNRMKPNKGRDDANYKEMISRRDQSLRVQGIMEAERTRLKRTMDSYSNVSIVAREAAMPGSVIIIDNTRFEVKNVLKHAIFKRAGDVIEVVGTGNR